MSEITVFDNPEQHEIVIEIPLADGIAISVCMDDTTAQEMITIVQNKLNARFF